MYLSKEDLWDVLIHVGFNKNVHLFVSYDGKSNEYIWNKIHQDGHTVDTHIYDNTLSDVIKHRQYSIKTNHLKNSALTKYESYLI